MDKVLSRAYNAVLAYLIRPHYGRNYFFYSNLILTLTVNGETIRDSSMVFSRVDRLLRIGVLVFYLHFTSSCCVSHIVSHKSYRCHEIMLASQSFLNTLVLPYVLRIVAKMS